jgi:hypothetical protein
LKKIGFAHQGSFCFFVMLTKIYNNNEKYRKKSIFFQNYFGAKFTCLCGNVLWFIKSYVRFFKGFKKRTRSCYKKSPQESASSLDNIELYCDRSQETLQLDNCTLGSCSAFTEWTAWTTCNKMCSGFRTRSRNCAADPCNAGYLVESQPCSQLNGCDSFDLRKESLQLDYFLLFLKINKLKKKQRNRIEPSHWHYQERRYQAHRFDHSEERAACRVLESNGPVRASRSYCLQRAWLQ